MIKYMNRNFTKEGLNMTDKLVKKILNIKCH